MRFTKKQRKILGYSVQLFPVIVVIALLQHKYIIVDTWWLLLALVSGAFVCALLLAIGQTIRKD